MKFKSALVTEASGSIGGLTASHNRGGQYLRARAIPVNSNTSFQQAVRNYLKLIVGAWNAILTAPQRDGWAAYADAVTMPDPLGEPRKLPPLAMYVACNVPRLQAGLTRVDAPPAVLVLPTLTSPVYTVTAPTTGSLAFTNTDAWAIASGGALLLATARGCGTGINYFKGPYRYAGKVPGGATPPTSPQSIAPAFSVVATQLVHYKVRATLADGRLSGPLFLVCTAS